MPCPSHSSTFDHSNIWQGLQLKNLLTVQSPPFPSYLLPLIHKYLPQDPIFKHTEHMFFSQCDRPSFTPIKNESQNYRPVYFNLCTLG